MPSFVRQQQQRIRILEALLDGYDDGRSKGFYCLSANLLPIDALVGIVVEAKNERKSTIDPIRLAEHVKMKCMKAAEESGIELVYRKGKA